MMLKREASTCLAVHVPLNIETEAYLELFETHMMERLQQDSNLNLLG